MKHIAIALLLVIAILTGATTALASSPHWMPGPAELCNYTYTGWMGHQYTQKGYVWHDLLHKTDKCMPFVSRHHAKKPATTSTSSVSPPISPPDNQPPSNESNQTQPPGPPIVPPPVNPTLSLSYQSDDDRDSYDFTCGANGYDPTSYDWYFGDGHKLLHIEESVVHHDYPQKHFNVGYSVRCEATNGSLTKVATTSIVVPDQTGHGAS